MIMRNCKKQNKQTAEASKRWDKIYKEETDRLEVSLHVEKEIKDLVSFFKENNVKRILDLGCGAGRHIIYLAQNGFEVFGIDISRVGIIKAKQRLKEMNLRAKLNIGNIYTTLPYKDNFFDAAISVKTIYHGTIEEIRKAI